MVSARMLKQASIVYHGRWQCWAWWWWWWDTGPGSDPWWCTGHGDCRGCAVDVPSRLCLSWFHVLGDQLPPSGLIFVKTESQVSLVPPSPWSRVNSHHADSKTITTTPSSLISCIWLIDTNLVLPFLVPSDSPSTLKILFQNIAETPLSVVLESVKSYHPLHHLVVWSAWKKWCFIRWSKKRCRVKAICWVPLWRYAHWRVRVVRQEVASTTTVFKSYVEEKA